MLSLRISRGEEKVKEMDPSILNTSVHSAASGETSFKEHSIEPSKEHSKELLKEHFTEFQEHSIKEESPFSAPSSSSPPKSSSLISTNTSHINPLNSDGNNKDTTTNPIPNPSSNPHPNPNQDPKHDANHNASLNPKSANPEHDTNTNPNLNSKNDPQYKPKLSQTLGGVDSMDQYIDNKLGAQQGLEVIGGIRKGMISIRVYIWSYLCHYLSSFICLYLYLHIYIHIFKYAYLNIYIEMKLNEVEQGGAWCQIDLNIYDNKVNENHQEKIIEKINSNIKNMKMFKSNLKYSKKLKRPLPNGFFMLDIE